MEITPHPKVRNNNESEVSLQIQSDGIAQDLPEYLKALNGERRYQFVPRRYFLQTFCIYALTLSLLAFFCHGIFIVGAIPAFAFMALKLRIFSLRCRQFNLSGKKIIVLLFLWFLLSLYLTSLLWNWIEVMFVYLHL